MSEVIGYEKGQSIPPDVCTAIFSHAFIVETIDCRDLARFVIATDERYSVWVSDFETEKEEK